MNTPDPVGRWAAAHASTVTAVAPDGSRPPEPIPEPGPTTLASFTETLTWAADSAATFAVKWGHQADGQLVLATGGVDHTARIWDPDTGSILHTLTGHTEQVDAVAWGYRPDGDPLLATASDDGTARIWDPGTADTLHTLTGHTGTVNAAGWGTSADGRPLLATADSDGTVRIWNPDTGETRQTLTGHTMRVNAAAWASSADGRRLLATASNDQTARIWDPDTGVTLHTLTGHTNTVTAVAWGCRLDGQPLLATTALDGTARIWSWDEGEDEFTAHVLAPGADAMFCAAWAPLTDGRMLLATTSTGALHLWDAYTRELLHTEELNFVGTKVNHLDWAKTAAGGLALAAASAGGQVHTWDVSLTPPSLQVATERQAGESRRSPRGTGVVLESIEDITAEFPEPDEIPMRIDNLACTTTRPDGRMLLAVVSHSDTGWIWDLQAGRIVHALTGHTGWLFSVAWGQGASGQLLLATASHDHAARIWDPATGETLHILTGHTGTVRSVAWGSQPDGRPLLATAGDHTARIWDPDTGETLHTLTEHTNDVHTVAWGTSASGRPLLATASQDETARIWDPDTGETLQTLEHASQVQAAAWGTTADGYPLLATASSDGTARIWDPGTGETLQTLTGHTDRIHSAAWGAGPDGQPVLVTAGGDSTMRIWDPDTGAELSSVACSANYRESVTSVPGPAGDLLVVAADPSTPERPARVWRVRVSGGGRVRVTAGGGGRHAQVGRGLLRLGSAGLWLPLGLVDDLAALTAPQPGPDRGLNDARLAALSDDPGIARLRDLGWPAAARLAFTALLTSRLAIPPQYTPPAGTPPAQLRDTLHDTLATRTAPARPAAITPRDLQAAAAQITDRTATLLTILGPAACTADPLLPVRLAHRIPQLPALSRHQIQLITAAGTRPAADRDEGAGTLLYSPGTAGLARTGPLTRLLPTQLALPRKLMTMHLANSQLLYRQHRAPAPPAPQPVTILLDTTPPTHGPAGHVLRLAAHLLTTTLWAYGQAPALITLTDPETTTTLTQPADLLHLWTSTTLQEPWPALATAIRTAAPAGHPLILFTHHHTPAGIYPATPRTRLLTSHHPPEDPPPHTSPHHRHLPPNPTPAQLTRAITHLLTPTTPPGHHTP